MRLTGLLAALLLPSLLHAGEADKPLEIQLISETRSITAGRPFFLGLHLVHPLGSHTYWKHPGIVGLATTVAWDLPPGFSAGEIQWPAPQVVKMAGYEAQGYEGETLLLIPITPPEILSAASVVLTAKVSWMCCGQACSPAVKIPFSLTLPVGGSLENDPSTHPLFEKFRTLVPGPPSEWKTISVKRDGEKIIVTLDPVLGQRDPLGDDHPPIHFFTADGQVDSNRNQESKVSPEGEVVLTLVASKTGPNRPATLPGVLKIPTGKRPHYFGINPAY